MYKGHLRHAMDYFGRMSVAPSVATTPSATNFVGKRNPFPEIPPPFSAPTVQPSQVIGSICNLEIWMYNRKMASEYPRKIHDNADVRPMHTTGLELGAYFLSS
jgi:hypothetical protein